jgi:hypothetical protein
VTDSIIATFVDTQSALTERLDGKSWRALAAELGLPHGTLHAIGTGRWEHVAWDTLRLVRDKLSLSDPGPVVATLACPDCGAVHTGRCDGKQVVQVACLAEGERVTDEPLPKPSRPRKPSGPTAEQRTRRQRLAVTWDAVREAGLRALELSEAALSAALSEYERAQNALCEQAV